MCEGGEGGIREGEGLWRRDYSFLDAFDERGELGVLGRVGLQWGLQCTGG